MRLELQGLLNDDPGLAARLDALPGRVFSGKRHPQPGTQAVFFCYRIPYPVAAAPGAAGSVEADDADAGETRWYLYELATDAIREEPTDIAEVIRCVPATPRHCAIEPATLAEVRTKIEKHIKNTRLKQLQAPIHVKPLLKAWLELN